jgi:hypothetical protein
MPKTKIVNESQQSVLVKEGSSGVYRALKVIKEHESYVITTDPNSTYREFSLVVGDGAESLVLTSDDIWEFREIKILPKPDGIGIMWEATSLIQESGAPEEGNRPWLAKLAKLLRLA